ncbi:MAG: hypothetical protein GY869_06035, partial [Planctomycetes bacterium]|nr:hypothetical protein [Planctomycetota bacterium]
MTGILINFIAIFILQTITPFWWWVVIVPFVYGLFKTRSAWHSFYCGLAGAGLLWLIGSGYYLLTASDIIAARAVTMFQLGHAGYLVLSAVFIAGLCGGSAGL